MVWRPELGSRCVRTHPRKSIWRKKHCVFWRPHVFCVRSAVLPASPPGSVPGCRYCFLRPHVFLRPRNVFSASARSDAKKHLPNPAPGNASAPWTPNHQSNSRALIPSLNESAPGRPEAEFFSDRFVFPTGRKKHIQMGGGDGRGAEGPALTPSSFSRQDPDLGLRPRPRPPTSAQEENSRFWLPTKTIPSGKMTWRAKRAGGKCDYGSPQKAFYLKENDPAREARRENHGYGSPQRRFT